MCDGGTIIDDEEERGVLSGQQRNGDSMHREPEHGAPA
jgi:hypothetical protein